MAANNVCVFTGRLATDPELRNLINGGKVVKFNLAVPRSYKQGNEWKDATVFLKMEAWDEAATTIAERFSKGDGILVHAEARSDSWNDKTTGEKRSAIIFRVSHYQAVTIGRRPKADEDEAEDNEAEPVESEDENKIPF